MKKTYMHPEMEIVEIKKQVLLAGSLEVFDEVVNEGDILAPEFDDIPDLSFASDL